MFAILQKYDFSSKSQPDNRYSACQLSCLRYCKSTIFQANHNKAAEVKYFYWLFAILQKYDFSSKSQPLERDKILSQVVCDTAKVRFFKQITTTDGQSEQGGQLFAILQKYDFSSKSQLCAVFMSSFLVVCDTAKVRFFKQITTRPAAWVFQLLLFAILQKYDFSSKSQRNKTKLMRNKCCLRYCKSTIFQANHNQGIGVWAEEEVVCDTAKVRFFKQITTMLSPSAVFFGCLRYCKSTIFQANHNSSTTRAWRNSVVCDTAKVRFFKQITTQSVRRAFETGCLRYCKSTIFQANHNPWLREPYLPLVVCDTAKVRFFKQITTFLAFFAQLGRCLRYCKSTIFQANHNQFLYGDVNPIVVCDTAKVRFFKQITTFGVMKNKVFGLFAILQKYDFSSKSQPPPNLRAAPGCCLRYCKSTIFQANHNSTLQRMWATPLFAILQKYDFSSKSQLEIPIPHTSASCLRYCKSTIFQANHNF